MLVVGLSAQALGDGDRQWVRLPCAAQLVGVTARVEALSGAPTACSVSIYETVLDEVVAFAIFPAGTAAMWWSTHLGGAAIDANAPIRIARGDDLGVTINLTGGATPTVDYDVQLWFLEG